MVKKAVLVGINYTGSSAQLNGCINDVVRMSDTLVTKYGYKSENIVVLRDDISDPALRPTRENILKRLYALTHDNTSGLSEIWFHYSGHGSQIRDTDGDEADGQDEVLVPVDYLTKGMIVDDEIYKMIQDVKCKTILIIDACHSGSMCDLEYGLSVDVPRRRFDRFRNSSKRSLNPNIISISGCRDRQTSADAYSAELNMGVGAFTDAFLYTLEHYNYKGSLMFIYQETCRVLHARRFPQMPVLSSSGPSVDYTFNPVQLQLN